MLGRVEEQTRGGWESQCRYPGTTSREAKSVEKREDGPGGEERPGSWTGRGS